LIKFVQIVKHSYFYFSLLRLIPFCDRCFLPLGLKKSRH
jgi:hypothetical protein